MANRESNPARELPQSLSMRTPGHGLQHTTDTHNSLQIDSKQTIHEQPFFRFLDLPLEVKGLVLQYAFETQPFISGQPLKETTHMPGINLSATNREMFKLTKHLISNRPHLWYNSPRALRPVPPAGDRFWPIGAIKSKGQTSDTPVEVPVNYHIQELVFGLRFLVRHTQTRLDDIDWQCPHPDELVDFDNLDWPWVASGPLTVIPRKVNPTTLADEGPDPDQLYLHDHERVSSCGSSVLEWLLFEDQWDHHKRNEAKFDIILMRRNWNWILGNKYDMKRWPKDTDAEQVVDDFKHSYYRDIQTLKLGLAGFTFWQEIYGMPSLPAMHSRVPFHILDMFMLLAWIPHDDARVIQVVGQGAFELEETLHLCDEVMRELQDSGTSASSQSVQIKALLLAMLEHGAPPDWTSLLLAKEIVFRDDTVAE